MAIKKKQKKVVKQKPKSKTLERTVAKLTSHLGNIEKLVNPKEKEVRVKTFIVEKPVYVSSDRKFPARGYDTETEPERVYDSRRSRYTKKKDSLDDDSFSDKETNSKDDLEYEDSTDAKDQDENIDAQDDLGEASDVTDDDASFGEEGEAAGEFEEDSVPKNAGRSHAGITALLSVWWKRAIVFGIIWWLFVLAFILLLQAFNLVTVDINRGWWIFLGIIVALSIVYQKFLSGKI